jgi:hypothetical protein
MTTTCRVAACLLFLSCVSTVIFAAQETTPLIAAASAEKVRFLSPGPVRQMRVQIFSPDGSPLFDSDWKDGNVLDWPADNALASGPYRCLAMVREMDGRVTQKEFSIEQSDDAGLKVMLLVHDGFNGSVVSTSGDLVFRFGNFLAAKDGERMRLTAEGNLGIGIDKPQAPLDVNGLIRTSKGIMFADGTVLTTASGLPGAQENGGAIQPRPIAPIGMPFMTAGSTATSKRLTPAPNAADYQFKVDGTGVHIGNTSAYGLDVAGNVALSSNLALPATAAGGTAGVITIGGTRFHNFGSSSTFVGANAGNFTLIPGSTFNNTGIGSDALSGLNSGTGNTAVGTGAQRENISGMFNTAIGEGSLLANQTGERNTGIGEGALIGTTGSFNIALGARAGDQLTTGSSNIDIGNVGVAGESGTIRIGNTQTRAFLAGVRNVTTGVADGLAVLIDSSGQLGTTSSSARVKREIIDMGDVSTALQKLRPVSFCYRNDTVGIRQYGLIAEEVAEVMPELVQFSSTGEPETVRYHFLAPLMLNELQRQQRTIDEQRQENAALRTRLERLEKLVAEMRGEK